jgi:hypothetical protein
MKEHGQFHGLYAVEYLEGGGRGLCKINLSELYLAVFNSEYIKLNQLIAFG